MDIGKINFPLKINFTIRCHLETDMKRLFESKKKVNAIGAPDAKIVFTKAPFVQYEQFLLGKNFRQYIETTMISKKFNVWESKKDHSKKYTKFLLGTDSINLELYGSNRQFDWLEMSLVYHKGELAAKLIKFWLLKILPRLIV